MIFNNKNFGIGFAISVQIVKEAYMRTYFSQFILHSSVFAFSTLTASITLANEQRPVSEKEDVVTLQSVVVTGSRRAINSALEAPAPVDIVTAKELQETGAGDLAAALTRLSPSVSLPTSPAGGFGASVPPSIALRGLSADQTLILINGKRRHTAAYFTRQAYAGGRGAAVTDLSLIPISAIERIEILRDGAAAQYGSDAIAGVVNIILKSRDHGGGVSYQIGGYTQGDGEQHKINLWKSFELPNDGALTVAVDLGKREAASNTAPDTRTFYDGSTQAQYTEQNTPFRSWKFGSPEQKDQINITANLDLPLTDELALYGFSSYGHRKTIGENFYEPPTTKTVLNQSIYFKQRYPDGRSPLSLVSVDDFATTFGVKQGNQTSGKYDLYATYGQNKVSTEQGNGINPSYGADSPSHYDLGENIFAQLNTGLDYSRDFAIDGLASPLTVSTGALYRWEQYKQNAGDPIAYTRGPYFNPSTALGTGIPGIYAGITDQDQRKISRDVYGIYLDLEADIVKDLNVGAAIRTEKYSDFGSTTNGKLFAKYDISPQLTLRGSVNTGYRAPSLAQQGYSAYSVQTVQTPTGWQDVQQRTLVAGSEAALLIGGTSLKPEKSTNYSLGLVLKPFINTSATLDLYQIDIRNRILLSDNITGSVINNAFANTPYANIANVAFFNNLLDTQTRGLEFALKHDLDLEQYGKLKLNLGLAYHKNKITDSRDSITAKGERIPVSSIAGRNTQSLIESTAPKTKLALGALWSNQAWSINAAVRRYDKWTTLNNTNTSLDQTFDPQWIADLDFGYKADAWVKGLKFNLGANNLFNSYPDKAKDSSVGNIVKYSFNAPEGAFGTYLYGRVSYDF